MKCTPSVPERRGAVYVGKGRRFMDLADQARNEFTARNLVHLLDVYG